MMNDTIRRMLVSYLERHPEERERLAHFETQLREDGENDQDITARSNMKGHSTGTMVILDAEMENVLLIAHKHHGMWLSPGGHMDPGETPRDTALREALEETGVEGITLLSEDPIDIDTHPITARPQKNETEHHHHDFLFVGIAPEGAILDHQEKEVDEARWFGMDTLESNAPHMQRVKDKLVSFIANLP